MMQLQPVSLSRIFCPVDFSQPSHDPLRMALALGRVYRAEVFVCYCLEWANMQEAATGRILQRMDEMAFDNLLFEPHPMPKWRLLVLEGNAPTAVPKAAESYGADLVVTCPKKQNHPHQWLNSTVRAISVNAPCPVLVVRNTPSSEPGPPITRREPEKIMVVCDFSNDSQLALAHGFSLARKFQAELHILFSGSKASIRKFGETSKKAFAPMNQADPFAELIQRFLPPEILNQPRLTLMRLEGPSLRDILLYAKDRKTDLLCLGIQGIRSEMNPLYGSNGKLLLTHAPSPVLLARPLRLFGRDKNPIQKEAGTVPPTSAVS